MRQTKVKICGIRSLESAQAAIDAGADFLGFNFAFGYSRYIEPRKALAIISALAHNGKTKLVGVFLDEDYRIVNAICAMLGLEYVQLHGNETSGYCSRIRAHVIKTVSLNNTLNGMGILQNMRHYAVDYFLLDIAKGTDGSIIEYLAQAREVAREVPLFLSGKLDSQNVAEAIETVQPFAVDVARGIEAEGRGDPIKIQEFIKEAKYEKN